MTVLTRIGTRSLIVVKFVLMLVLLECRTRPVRKRLLTRRRLKLSKIVFPIVNWVVVPFLVVVSVNRKLTLVWSHRSRFTGGVLTS